MQAFWQWIRREDRFPRRAKLLGGIAFALGLACAVMPRTGVLRLEPIAVVCGTVCLWAGMSALGYGVFVLLAMDLILSPAFWRSLTHWAAPGSLADSAGAYFDLVGVIAMSVALVRQALVRRPERQAATPEQESDAEPN
ncbi:hypothetical protein [Alicyclobacillus acidocaldarius]|uniref:Uncharacterized protein n=1 Tax=Alicyclobacillus acidocaldarius subsp. acidocaldarius (strain ATCC 27009 / DSM 446 / BCRC 14685 / JCM 5260 / KCTC 1825 / NBRC 15652 / NCIMB 11725 / NRRL B-14509 / 104-IA) TaxID=521098 RepID=C8WT99_ALIAD|nr:hypothetical protein [Alicyclobacillus acidocaldarius]ACV59613.1 hypothetical protein Aaci_2609 [Alicyclobacillus acidocaldarius subsp. acidocaldarius DSM 446]